MRWKEGLKKAFNEYFIFTLIIAAFAIISSMLVIHFITYKPQRFSALGLLNENYETGPFPKEINYNETFDVYFNVLNFEGQPELYKVNYFKGDNTTTIDPVLGSLNATFNSSYQKIINHEEIWEEKLSLSFSIPEVKNNTKLIFELWKYNTIQGKFHFLDITTHLWINITYLS